jgi:hypothetical protein
VLFGWHMNKVYVSLHNIISEEVVPHAICLVLEYSMEVLATLMALVLSHMRGTWVHSPKSLIVYLIQSSCEQQLAVATYSASMVD